LGWRYVVDDTSRFSQLRWPDTMADVRHEITPELIRCMSAQQCSRLRRVGPALLSAAGAAVKFRY